MQLHRSRQPFGTRRVQPVRTRCCGPSRRKCERRRLVRSRDPLVRQRSGHVRHGPIRHPAAWKGGQHSGALCRLMPALLFCNGIFCTVQSIVFSLFVAFISIKSSFDVSYAPVDMRAVPPERLLCVWGLHALHALRERAKAEPRSRLNRSGRESAIGSCCTFAQELPYDRNTSSFIIHFYFAQVND